MLQRQLLQIADKNEKIGPSRVRRICVTSTGRTALTPSLKRESAHSPHAGECADSLLRLDSALAGTWAAPSLEAVRRGGRRGPVGAPCTHLPSEVTARADAPHQLSVGYGQRDRLPRPQTAARRHRRLAAAASSREHLKQLATVSAKALPARCAPRPMRSPARGAATASTSGSRRPLASVSSPLPVMPTQHNWKSIQGLVRNDGVELLSGRCELCAEAAVARGSVSRKFSPSGMPVAKCRTGCDVCKVHICQKCYRAGLFESYAHPGDCSGLGSSSVMMD